MRALKLALLVLFYLQTKAQPVPEYPWKWIGCHELSVAPTDQNRANQREASLALLPRRFEVSWEKSSWKFDTFKVEALDPGIYWPSSWQVHKGDLTLRWNIDDVFYVLTLKLAGDEITGTVDVDALSDKFPRQHVLSFPVQGRRYAYQARHRPPPPHFLESRNPR